MADVGEAVCLGVVLFKGLEDGQARGEIFCHDTGLKTLDRGVANLKQYSQTAAYKECT